MKTKIISLLLLIMLTLTAISCDQEVIFYDIAREVELVDPEINGNIFSIVPLAGKLYVQNGYIYVKNTVSEAHGWTLISKPENSGSIIRLASDDSYLYIMDSHLDSEGNPLHTVWVKAAASLSTEGGWSQIADNVTELFDNQVADGSFSTAGRSAYITITTAISGDTANVNQVVKQLSGTGTPVAVSDPVITATVPNGKYIKAAVYDGTATVFSSNASICVSGTTLYSVDSSDSANQKVVKYKTQGGSWTNGGSVTDVPTCICAYGTDKILVGTENGYEICTINSATKQPSDGENSTTNAETQFGTKRRIITIKAFGPASGQSVYAAVINDDTSAYSKLWGWFGENWNYE